MSKMSADNIREIKDRVKNAPISQLIGSSIRLTAKSGGREYLGLCPFHAEKTPSFRVYDKRGLFKCYGCGESGDVISFIEKVENVDFVEALKRAASFFGISVSENGNVYQPVKFKVTRETSQEYIHRIEKKKKKARDLFRAAKKADGTIVETYLRDVRKINVGALPGGVVPLTIRCMPAHDYWGVFKDQFVLIGKFPAMITAMQDSNGHIVAVHQIYLDPKTGEKVRLKSPDGKEDLPSKKMLGPSWATSIRLGERASYMGVAEGIENALICMAEGGPVVWAAGSLNNLAGPGIGQGKAREDNPEMYYPSVYPDMDAPSFFLPPECERVLIIQDNDSKDPLAAKALFERCARRHALLGKEVGYAVPPKGFDLNDVKLLEGSNYAH